MFLGKVIGTVWSTKKTPDLEGVRFLIVHPYDLDREPTSETSDCAAAWSPSERFRALAVLYAVESAQPAISRTKLAGLVEHYGFDAACMVGGNLTSGDIRHGRLT